MLRKLALKRLTDREDLTISIPPEVHEAESVAAWNSFLRAQPEFQGSVGQLLHSNSRTPVVSANVLRNGAEDFFLFGDPGRKTQ